MRSFPVAGLSADEVGSVAAGSTLGLEQQLLANDGQVGLTVLAVGFVAHQTDAEGDAVMRAQISSLGEGNVVFVYADGADFSAGVVQEGPIFLGLGEIYVIENCRNGTIITSTEGAYGFSQQRRGNSESPMPLLSLALAFTDTFFFAFRASSSSGILNPTGTFNQGWIHVVNGPIASEVTLEFGSGGVVDGQENIPLDPWQYFRLFTNGNVEYRLTSTNSIMACINADMGTTNSDFFDSRLILPLTNDGITWPRNGDLSAPFNNTQVRYWVNDGAAWDVGAGAILDVSPGSPVDISAAQPTGTGASDSDYQPEGATRFRAGGLITAYSGADSSGLEASPMAATNTFTQRVALPLLVDNSGDGGNNGIAIASPFQGRAQVFQWNSATGVADLVTFETPGTGAPTTEVIIERRSGSVTTADDQNYPASALISAAGGTGTADGDAYGLSSDFTGGYIEADVPICVVFNSNENQNGGTTSTHRGTSGPAVPAIHSDDDEQLSYGIIPETIRSEVRLGRDGLLYKRVIAAGGGDTWEVA